MAIPSFEELLYQQNHGLGMPGDDQAGGEAAPIGLGNPPPQFAAPPSAMPPGPPGPPGPPATGGSWNDAIAGQRNALMGMGLGMLGGGWRGGMAGFAAGAPIDERARAQAAQLQQHRLDQAQAQANADRAFALQSAPQIVKVKGLFGDEIMIRDPRTGELKPYTGPGAGGSASGVSPDVGKYDETGVDNDYLEEVRKRYGSPIAEGVKAMAEGRLPSAGFGAIKQLAPLTTRYKQGFDATAYLLHLQSEKAFQPGGKYFEKVRALEQAGQHGNQLWDLGEKLGGTNLLPSSVGGGLLNQGLQAMRGAGGSPEAAQYQSDLSEYQRLAGLIGQEMVTAAKSGSDVKAAREIQASLSNARTPAERHGALKAAFDYLEGAHQALEETRSRSFTGLRPLLSPETQSRYDRILQYREGAPASSGAAPSSGATAPGGGSTGAPARSGVGTPPRPRPGMKIQTRGNQWREVPDNG